MIDSKQVLMQATVAARSVATVCEMVIDIHSKYLVPEAPRRRDKRAFVKDVLALNLSAEIAESELDALDAFKDSVAF